MKINIDKNLKVPIYLQISNQLKNKIVHSEFIDNTTLPSERSLAKILGVHRNTVVRAYNELKAEGFIESKQGVGYTVSLPKESYEHEMKKNKRVNWINIIKEEYFDLEVTFDDLFLRIGEEDKFSLGGGVASTDVYEREQIASYVTEILAGEDKSKLFYSPYKGDKFLRQKLASFMRTKGVKATTGQIQILSETNQALDFVFTLLVRKGDTVIIEDPISPDYYRALELAGARLITVPVDEDGMNCDILEELVEKHRPRFIFVCSSFHDPTGAILSLERRQKIIDVSNKYRIPIIEEDATSELSYMEDKLPPIKSMDTMGNVIYIYTFAFTFLPGISLAFIVADRELINKLSYLVAVRMISTDWTAQKLLGKCFDDGFQYKAFEKFRQNYMAKRDLVCKLLDEMKDLGISYEKPRGGIYVWCKLPDGIDSKIFISEAYKKGLALIPGYIFYPFKNGGRDYVRICYSWENAEGIAGGMEVFKDTIKSMLAHKK